MKKESVLDAEELRQIQDSGLYDEDEPEQEAQGFEFGGISLVGHGRQTNDNCGKFVRFLACLNVLLHNIVTLDGVNHAGKVDVHARHFCCFNPRCPICYKNWAIREAKNIVRRLSEGSKRFGVAEHIIASVPAKDYGLSPEALRVKVVKILAARGCLGGALVYHPARYNNAEEARSKGVLMGWYFSPHFHVLGFVRGGYGRCRTCKGADCYACSGFEGVTRRCNKEDGYVVKIMDKRKTVFGSAYYELNHAGLRADQKRFHVATWFGTCSYRKLKVKAGDREKEVCRICQHELVRARYVGVNDRLYFLKVQHKSFYDDFLDSEGRPQWLVDDVKPCKKHYSE